MAFGACFAKTLSILGVKKIFFSPGSRSTPMVIGVERFSDIDLIPVLDERTAAFLALGQSKRKKQPVGLICTSGSALTHWFPAVTEASHSGIPLLLFLRTALRNCRIAVQVKLSISKIYLAILFANFTSLKFRKLMKIIVTTW